MSEEQRRAIWQLPPLRLQKLAAAETALVEELRQWRQDIESEIAAYNWEYNSSVGLASQQDLADLLEQSCHGFAGADSARDACAPIPQYGRKPTDAGMLRDYIRYQHPARIYAAHELGRQRSLAGLQFLVDRREVDLLLAYADEYGRKGRGEPLSPGVEELLISHYGDPQIGLPLLRLLGVEAYYYRERRLFDLMYAELAAGQPRLCSPSQPCRDGAPSPTAEERSRLAYNITRTLLPGIEAPLLELLPRLSLEEQLIFFGFFAKRGYAPAVPHIVQVLLTQAGEGGAEAETIHFRLVKALGQIATQEAVDALLASLQKHLPLKQASRPRPAEIILNELYLLPPSLYLDWQAVKQAFPQPLDEKDFPGYFGLVGNRKICQETPALLEYIASGPAEATRRSVEVLVGFGDAALCAEAKIALEKRPQAGGMEEGRYRYLQSALQECRATTPVSTRVEKPADPLAYYRVPHSWLKQEPEAFVAAQRVYLAELEKLPPATKHGGVSEVNTAGLGDILRFRLRQPEQAIQEYQRLSGGEKELSLAALIKIADTFRYDLRDQAHALDYYRQALARAQQLGKDSASPLESLLRSGGEWRRAWLEHEIAYLESGRRFSGSLAKQHLGLFGGAWLNGLIGSIVLPPARLGYIDPAMMQDDELLQPTKVYQERAAVLLPGLPPGTPVLLSALPYLAGLDDPEKILAYLNERDPAGFLSANFFGFIVTAEEAGGRQARKLEQIGGGQEAMKTAATAFLQRHGIQIQQADPRFASPEQTWQEYLAALRQGDANRALECFSPAMSKKLRFLRGLRADKLKAMADSFVAFEPAPDGGKERGEYMTVRETDGKKQVGFVHFAKSQGEWKIEGM
jgi:hypothetical protein